MVIRLKLFLTWLP